jgi:hypothetical protein
MPGVFLFGPVNRLTRGYSKFFKNLWGVGVVALSITKVLGAGGE